MKEYLGLAFYKFYFPISSSNEIRHSNSYVIVEIDFQRFSSSLQLLLPDTARTRYACTYRSLSFVGRHPTLLSHMRETNLACSPKHSFLEVVLIV